MKNLTLALALVFSTTTFADTGSLWCALSSYGTPTQVADASALAYELIQVDKLSDSKIQVSIDDIYYETSKVLEVEFVKGTGSISGIALGKYSKNVEISMKNGKILLKHGNSVTNCEIPGDFQLDYSSYVK